MSEKLRTPDVIDEVMTPCPETVEYHATCEEARDRMHELQVRHLPVLDHGKIAGVVSHRDLQFALGWSGKSGKALKIEDILNKEPYLVSVGTPLHEVLRHMADDRLGSALVADEAGELVGIFTSTDACDILAEMLI